MVVGPRQDAEPARQSSQESFHWVSPLPGSSFLVECTMLTTSPTRVRSNSHRAFAVLMPTHPWLTLATPCEATDQGAAWMNSPEFVIRSA